MQNDPTQAVQILQQDNSTLINQLHSIEIASQHEQQILQDDVILIKSQVDKAIAVKKGLEEPLLEGLKRIRSLFNPFIYSLQQAEHAGTKKLSDWRISEQQRNEKLIDTVAVDYFAKVREARETGEKVEIPELPVLQQPKTIHSNAGGLTYIEDFDVIVIDPDKIDRKYCMYSMSKLRAAVKSGATHIEGCIIKPKYIPRRTTQR